MILSEARRVRVPVCTTVYGYPFMLAILSEVRRYVCLLLAAYMHAVYGYPSIC
jgi:hypothetical protein